MLSRGMKAFELVDFSTWWRGPEFLRLTDEMWPVNKSFEKPRDDNKMKRLLKLNRAAGSYHESESTNETHGFVTIAEDTVFPVDRSKTLLVWLKLRRIQSWSDRVIQNCQRKKTDRIYGELLADELRQAEFQLVIYAQSTKFREERTALSRGRSLSVHSKLLRLQPKIRRGWTAAFWWTVEEYKIPFVWY